MSAAKRILIVEDDIDIQETFAEILISEGYEVVTASNGREGLKQLEQSSEFHLVILDLMMPVLDGFGFRAEQLKNSEWAKIPVLVLSADGHIHKKLEGMPGIAYLKKPPDLDALLEKTRKHCR